jgi:hypothetical protein
LVGSVAVWQTRSARTSEESLSSYLSVKEKIERYALLDARAKFNGLIGQSYPSTLEAQTKLVEADNAEMGGIITSLKKAALTAQEHAAVDKIETARNGFLSLDITKMDISTPAKLAAVSVIFDTAMAAQTEAVAAALKLLQVSVVQQQDRVADAVRNLTWLLLAVSIGAGLLIAVGLSLFGRQLVRRIGLLDDALGSVVKG